VMLAPAPCAEALGAANVKPHAAQASRKAGASTPKPTFIG
jgi:hypothetical protein